VTPSGRKGRARHGRSGHPPCRICDGTGTESFIGTLGVTAGRITSLGPDTGLAAKRTINADGLVLAPGLSIRIRTMMHRSPGTRSSPARLARRDHGGDGNCGWGGPREPETRDILLHDLENVEAIPYDVMQAAIDWRWESYGDYLDVVDQGGLGINVAGLVAFTPLRHYVMGEASFERQATPDEITTMRACSGAMRAGRLGSVPPIRAITWAMAVGLWPAGMPVRPNWWLMPGLARGGAWHD